MANQEHLDILRQGVDVWNRWRVEHGDIKPDLSGANLSLVELFGADLSGANLWEAYLVGADLNLADLSGAILQNANLSHTELYGTDFSGAELALTLFGNVDLSMVKGLEKVEHIGPSTIGIDTIYQSHGQIPETFLRGAGVPDSFIDYMHSLVSEPFDYYSCFISYSHKDHAFAEKLHADLQRKGVRCWFAPHDLKIGDKIRARIDESIRLHDKLLLVLSKNSIESVWVEKEAETAFEKERLNKEREAERTVLFPIRLDDAVMKTSQAWAADIRRTRHIGDFRNWKNHDDYQRALNRLLRDLKAEG